tara:strand:+ start:90 stop:356 length:267 start_codon:yes stop_codon:yes gene_type:complete
MLNAAKTNVVAVFSSAWRLNSFQFLKIVYKTRHIAAAIMISDCHVGWVNQLINAFKNSMPALHKNCLMHPEFMCRICEQPVYTGQKWR